MNNASIFKFVKNFIFALILFTGLTASTNANDIIKINEMEFANIKLTSTANTNLFYREFDTNEWKTDVDFFKDFGIKMLFPYSTWNPRIYNLDMFEDLMRNLYWIKSNSITIVIKNLSNFSSTTGKVNKSFLLESFKECILPYWKGIQGTDSVVDCSDDKPKQFNIYYT